MKSLRTMQITLKERIPVSSKTPQTSETRNLLHKQALLPSSLQLQAERPELQRTSELQTTSVTGADDAWGNLSSKRRSDAVLAIYLCSWGFIASGAVRFYTCRRSCCAVRAATTLALGAVTHVLSPASGIPLYTPDPELVLHGSEGRAWSSRPQTKAAKALLHLGISRGLFAFNTVLQFGFWR